MLPGITALVSPVQPLNAWFPMLITLLGMVISVSPVQPLNVWFPMFVTPSEMDKVVRFVQ